MKMNLLRENPLTTSYPKLDAEELFEQEYDFEFVKCKVWREQLKITWLAVTQTNSWDYIKQNHINFYAYKKNPDLFIISNRMIYLGYDEILPGYGLSDIDFNSQMRTMQFIKNYGMRRFKAEVLFCQ